MADLLHVLLIEDSESDAELIRHCLQKDGYKLVSERVDSLTGLKAALKKPGWEVIISDYNLPGFNASAALAALQKTGKDIPFIIVSGKIEEETAIELMRTGAADYLVKDKLARLVPAVRRELQEARSRRSRREADEALIKSEFRYKLLFDNAPYGVVIIDPETTLPVNFNDIAHKQLGYTREEFYKIPINAFEVIESQQDIKAHIERLFKEGRDAFDTLHRTKQGEIRSVHVILQVLDFEGKKLEHCIYQDITERKQAENILRENEERFRMLYEDTPLGYQSLDIEGRFLEVNPAWLKMLGYSKEEVIGKWFGDFLIPSQRNLFMERFPGFVKAGEMHNFEFDMKHKDGRVKTVSFDGLIGHTAAGNFRQTHCIMKDITESKKAVETIRTHLALLNSMVTNISDVIAIMKVDGTVTYNSPNIEKWFGWQPNDLIGTDGWETVHPDDLERVQFTFLKLTRGDGNTDSIEFRFKCKDGTYRLIKMTAANLIHDPVINGILMNYHDVTEQREAEASQRVTEDKFRKSFQTSPDSININRLSDGLYIDINEGFTALTGFTREEVLGKTSQDINIWEDFEDRKRLVEGLRVHGKVTNLEASFRMKTGEIKICLMSASIIDIKGEPCILSISRDITDRKMAEEAIRLQSAALTSAANAIVITDSQMNIIFCNPAFEKLTGYTQTEALGRTVPSLIRSGEHDPRFYENLDSTIASGQIWHGEIISRRKNGQLFNDEMTVTPIFGLDGKITNYITIKQDITDRKKTEEDIQVQSAALDATANAVAITDANNRITWANQAFYELTGYSKEEARGQKLSDLIRSGAHEQSFYDNIAKTISNGKVWQGEIINRRKNGELYPEEMTVSPLIGKDGKITHYVSVKQDITEKKLTADVLKSRLRLVEYAVNHSPEEVLQETLAEAEKISGSLIGFYHFVSADQQSLTQRAWSKRTLQEYCRAESSEEHYQISKAGVWADCIRERKPVIHNDYASLDNRKGLPPGHAAVLRELVVPVFRGKKIVAVLGVGNKPSEYNERDVETITRLADLAWDIADKRMNEIALQESESRYRDLFENSAVPTWVEDLSEVAKVFEEIRAEGVTDMRAYFEQHPAQVIRCAELVKIVEVNNSSLRYMRLSSKEEIIANLPFYFSENSWPVFREQIIALAEGASHFTGDMPTLNSRKEERIHSLSLSVDPDHIKTLSRVLVSFLDITERRKVMETLRESTAKLEKAQNYAHMGSWTWNIKTNQLDLSDEMFRIFGLERETFSGSLEDVIAKAIHPDDRSKVDMSNLSVIQNEKQVPIEFRVVWPDQTVRVVWAEAGDFKFDESGNPVMISGYVLDITERKRVEEALRESEDRAKVIFNTLSEGVALNEMVFNDDKEMVDYRIIEVNEAFYRVADLQKDSWVIGNLASKIYRMDIATIKYFWENHKDSIDTIYSEFFSPINNRIYGVWTSPFVNNRFVTSFQDITERKQAEVALQKSEALLNETQLLSKIGGWEWDVKTQQMYWSDEVYRMHGISREEIPNGSPELDRRSQGCYHPEDRHLVDSAFELCFATGLPYELEARFISEQGENKWVRTMGKPVLENGKVVRVSGNIMDITESKQAEEEIRNRELLLEDSQKTAHLGSFVFDYENNTNIWSKETFRIFGMDENGKPPSKEEFNSFIHPDDHGRDLAMLENSFRNKAKYSLTYRIFRTDGVMRYVHSIGKPETNSEGKVVRLVGTIQDVTDSKTLEIALENSLEEKEVLLREIHHRVKNNLASILGLLEMERVSTTDPAADTMLKELGNRIRSMVTIHEKLYRSTNMAKIDFQDYLKSFISHLRTSLLPNSEVITLIEAPFVELSLDQAVPCGLIVNELVTNALKYAFPHGKPGVPGAEKCEIAVKMSVRKSAFTLVVSDNGVGLPPDLDWRNAKTLGLRLVIMLGEHQLGGKITLDRTSGTKFTFKFDPRHRE